MGPLSFASMSALVDARGDLWTVFVCCMSQRVDTDERAGGWIVVSQQCHQRVDTDERAGG